jgi:rubredoxin
MRLIAEVHTRYRCTSCGHLHDEWPAPDKNCCTDTAAVATVTTNRERN